MTTEARLRPCNKGRAYTVVLRAGMLQDVDTQRQSDDEKPRQLLHFLRRQYRHSTAEQVRACGDPRDGDVRALLPECFMRTCCSGRGTSKLGGSVSMAWRRSMRASCCVLDKHSAISEFRNVPSPGGWHISLPGPSYGTRVELSARFSRRPWVEPLPLPPRTLPVLLDDEHGARSPYSCNNILLYPF